MNNDDSFNDCDELLSLYSTKKIKDTFKAQLKKIAVNHELNKPLSYVNHIDCKKKGENVKEKQNPVSNKPNEPVLISEDDLQNTSFEVDNSLLEDSVEVIAELTPRATRRSERLRQKTNSNFQNSSKRNTKINVVPQTRNKRQAKNRRNSKRKKQEQQKSVCEVTLEDSPKPEEKDDELNPELTVKVIWKSVNLKKFQIRKFQKLSHIFEQLSKEENIPEDKIMLTFNNSMVTRNDTPDSLNLRVYHFLDGGVLSELSNWSDIPNEKQTDCDSNSVTLKFQGSHKNVIKISLNKNEKLRVGMIKCSEQLEVPLDKIRFFFDGELVQPDETPDSLGLENEEIIDFKISM